MGSDRVRDNLAAEQQQLLSAASEIFKRYFSVLEGPFDIVLLFSLCWNLFFHLLVCFPFIFEHSYNSYFKIFANSNL